jgi:hypothetical protein
MVEHRAIHVTSAPTSEVNLEQAMYLLLRLAVVGVGASIIFATIATDFMMPELYYDEMPGPPPLRERLPDIVLSFAVGLLLMVPNRWTSRGWMFWCRLGVYIILSGMLLWPAARLLLDGIDPGKSRKAVFAATALYVFAAVAIPICFVWSRRIRTIKRQSVP